MSASAPIIEKRSGVPPKGASPAASAKAEIRKILNVLDEPKSGGSNYKLRLIAQKEKGKAESFSGSVSADLVRRSLLEYQQRRHETQLQMGRMLGKPKSSDSKARKKGAAFKCHKRLEGEQTHRHPPTIGLNKRFGWIIRKAFFLLAALLEGLAFPLRQVRSKKRLGPTIFGIGLFFGVLSIPVFYLLTAWRLTLKSSSIYFLDGVAKYASWFFPLLLLSFCVICITAGIKFMTEKNYWSVFRPYYEPIPAWETEPVFNLGGIQKILSDWFEGTIVFGGIGSGKTASVIAPFILQLMRKLNNPDPKAVNAKWCGLVLDVKGNFADLLLYLFLQTGRSLQDLILIDPELDLYRYNPLDPEESQFAEKGAAKLSTVNQLMGNESGGENVYWSQTSKEVIRLILKTLVIIKPPNRIGVDDVWRYTRDDDRVGSLVRDARETLETKRRNNQISVDQYSEYSDTVNGLESNWHKLDGRTKGILKTTVGNMLGPLASNPVLQRTFCRDTNFSFKSLINDGRVALFRGRSLDRDCSRMLAVCMKKDFQEWCKRRFGSAASVFGLNNTRTAVLLIDEYQEVASCGGNGDESFCALCREARVIVFFATQVKASLGVAIKNEKELTTLLGSLTTKIFLKLSDKETQEMGANLSGKIYREREEGSISEGGMFSLMSGQLSTANKGASTQVRSHLEDYFKADEFGRLLVIPKSKSVNGPYYSEAIIYNYSETDPNKQSFASKNKMYHLYPNRAEMVNLSVVFDDLLYARNSQARCRRMLYHLGALAHNAYEREVAAGSSHKADLIRRHEEQVSMQMMHAKGTKTVELAKKSAASRMKALALRVDELSSLVTKEAEQRGKHSREYKQLLTELHDVQSEYTIYLVKEQTNKNRFSSSNLLEGRKFEELAIAAKKKGIQEVIKEEDPTKLAQSGITVGVTLKTDIPNLEAVQASAIRPKVDASKPEAPPASQSETDTTGPSIKEETSTNPASRSDAGEGQEPQAKGESATSTQQEQVQSETVAVAATSAQEVSQTVSDQAQGDSVSSTTSASESSEPEIQAQLPDMSKVYDYAKIYRSARTVDPMGMDTAREKMQRWSEQNYMFNNTYFDCEIAQETVGRNKADGDQSDVQTQIEAPASKAEVTSPKPVEDGPTVIPPAQPVANENPSQPSPGVSEGESGTRSHTHRGIRVRSRGMDSMFDTVSTAKPKTGSST